MFLNELIVLNQVAFHQRNPFVFWWVEQACTDFPKKGPNWIILKDKAITIVLVMLNSLELGSRTRTALLGKDCFFVKLNSFSWFVSEEWFDLIDVDDVLAKHVVDMAQSEVLSLQLSIDFGYFHVVGHVDQRIQYLLLFFGVLQGILII